MSNDNVPTGSSCYALVTEGVFLTESGAFLPLPKLATEPFLKLWEQEVFALLLRDGKITGDVVANIRSWKHSGFSVDPSVRLEAGDAQGIQRLVRAGAHVPGIRFSPSFRKLTIALLEELGHTSDVPGSRHQFERFTPRQPLFATTHWSAVARAGGGGDSAGTRAALSEVCRRYWYPLVLS